MFMKNLIEIVGVIIWLMIFAIFLKYAFGIKMNYYIYLPAGVVWWYIFKGIYSLFK